MSDRPALNSYMFKQGEFKVDDVFFEKFKNLWVVSSRSTFEEGRGRIEIPPTRFVPIEEKNQLKDVLRTILDEAVSVIPMAVLRTQTFNLTIPINSAPWV